MSLPTRKIGSSDVTAIGYGAMGISAYYGAIDSDEDRLKFLDDLYDSGCRFWDTADVYKDSEDLIGKWFKRSGKRNEIFLATKFAIVALGNAPGVNGTPEYVKTAIEKSLTRLRVDYVDLYYMHRPDPKVPIEETVGAMAELVAAGKVKYLGLSGVNASTLRRAHAVHPIAAAQLEYSVFTLNIEDPKIGILAAARELGVAVVAYSPLGRGLVTGRYKSPDDFEADDFRANVPKYSKENFPRILELVEELETVGKRYGGATAGQIALAWLLAQGPEVIPIPGTRRTKYLDENLGALKVNLSAAYVAEVRKIAEKADTLPGERYPSAMLALLYADTPEQK